MKHTLLAATAAAVSLSAAATAQVTTTTDRTTFEAGLSNPLVIDFAGVPDESFTAADAFAGIDFGFFTVTSETLSGFDGDVSIVNEQLGLFPDDAFGGTPSFTLTFDSPVTAFGADTFFINSDLPVTVDGQTFGTATDIGLVGDGFIGFTSPTPFSSVTFGPEFDSFRLDNLTFDVVPEPTSLALLGLGGLTLLRRRR